jgi:hypothetical protein
VNLHHKNGTVPGNAGQIIKEFLVDNGFEFASSGIKIRRAKRRFEKEIVVYRLFLSSVFCPTPPRIHAFRDLFTFICHSIMVYT